QLQRSTFSTRHLLLLGFRKKFKPIKWLQGKFSAGENVVVN
ncbi:3335_t:CDS:1, partial [Dentiscutata erythropus]